MRNGLAMRKFGVQAFGWANGAFTLVELLIVIAIISILAALLLPALKQAQAVAVTSVCLNNQRQAGIGIHTFADSHNGMLFVDWAYQGGKLRFWHEGLLGQVTQKRRYFSPIIDDRRTLACPVGGPDAKIPVFTGNNLIYNGEAGYYGGNAFLWSANPRAQVQFDEGNSYIHYYLRLTALPLPSTQMLLVDNRVGRLYYTNNAWSFPGVGQQVAGCVPNSFINGSYPRAIWLGHQNGSNVLYLDGHAARRDMLQLFSAGVTRVLTEGCETRTLP